MESITIPVRWVDIDSYQHVNNAKYFDYMTESRAQCLMKLVTDPNVQYILADTSCRFKLPITYPSNVIIEQIITDIGQTSFTIGYRFYADNNPNKICASGSARMVCFDVEQQKPCPVPDVIVSYLQQHLDSQ